MIEYFKKLSKSYRNAYLKITNLDNPKNLIKIDFYKPWWSILLQHKIKLLFILLGVAISFVFSALLPLIIKIAINSLHTSSFLYLFFIWIAVEIFRPITAYFYSVLVASVISSIRYCSYKFFLTVDPIFHSKRVGGEIVAKIERGAQEYYKFLDVSIYDFLPIIVRVMTVVITFWTIDAKLGLITMLLLLVMLGANVVSVLFNNFAFEKTIIKAEDSASAKSLESLMQINLIRSSFATNEFNNSLLSKNSFAFSVIGTYFISFFNLMFLSKIFYALSVCLIGVYILHLIQAGTVSVLDGVALLMTFFHGTYRSVRIGSRFRKMVRAVIRIKDLFTFVRKFGRQTFPVLKEDRTKKYELPTSDVISIEALNLHFSYESAEIFNEHNLKVDVPYIQKNKLYGIIGPSGVGKTTLISILGGQLRPDQGKIKLNGIPIYKINDNFKRKMIAIQGQSASNLSGELKESLLLGIPKGRSVFTDNYMEDILKRVGIWHIFEDKGGLSSMIGEGGLNLSVGQRQRLNFASLYLRTQYYKPFLVMIDEPTSSLDEVSEQAITDMIDEIATTSLVFVIAHRLRTLDEAVAILDFSLLEMEKDLKFYSRDELIHKSVYYQKLMRGEVALEE